jgi:hypothetical protein
MPITGDYPPCSRLLILFLRIRATPGLMNAELRLIRATPGLVLRILQSRPEGLDAEEGMRSAGASGLTTGSQLQRTAEAESQLNRTRRLWLVLAIRFGTDIHANVRY